MSERYLSTDTPFQIEAAAFLAERGVGEADQFLAHAWHVADMVDLHIEPDRWLAKAYLNEADPDIPDVCDQWRAVGDTVQTLRDFLDRVNKV